MSYNPTTDLWSDDDVPVNAAQINAAMAKRVAVAVAGSAIALAVGATNPRTLADYFSDAPNVLNWAGVPSSTVDQGPAFQAAHDALGSAGGIVFVNAGLFLVNTRVNVTNPVQFIGKGWDEFGQKGTQILTTVPSVSPFYINNSTCAGACIAKISFQQTQPVPASGWAPTVYAPTIDIESVDAEVSVEDCFFYGVYWAIKSELSGRARFKHIRGQPLYCGIFIDQAYDTSHCEDVHFWPYWSEAGSPGLPPRDPNHYVEAWMQQNAIAIWLQRVDGFQAPAIFIFGYKYGILLDQSAYGTTTLAQIGALYCDACYNPIHYSATAAGASMHVDSLYGTGLQVGTGTALYGSSIVYMNGSGQTLSIGAARMFVADGEMVIIDNPVGGNVLQIGNAEFNTFNGSGSHNNPAILSANATPPNKIFIANRSYVTAANGAPLINKCNAWARIPGNTPNFTPATSGGSISVLESREFTIGQASAGLASLTVALPATYLPNESLSFMVTQTVTAATVTAGGTTITGAPTALVANKKYTAMFLSSSITEEGANSWLFIQ